jgi:multisubunit Na+/H+ antiporter MnhE subunit
LGDKRTQAALFWIIDWGVLLGLWFLYTDTPTISELLAGAAAAAIAATATTVLELQTFGRFWARPRWLMLFLTQPWYVLTGSAAIFWALLRRIAGKESEAQLKAVQFDTGGEDDESAARRALAITLNTIPPNSIVIGIDRENQVLLMHEMVPSPIPATLKQLGAKA